MSLAAYAVEKRALTYFTVFLLVAAGIASFFALGQLEDPEFTVKTAVVTTSYPGASPEEVELEVTDRIEIALQELKQLDYLESFSQAGFSLIKVNIKSEYWADRLPQVWDEMRRKIRDIEGQLPPGAGRPIISDDFGDVFGFQLAITGDGFSYAELEEYAKSLKKEFSLVPGVARVDLWGVQKKVIYIDVSDVQLSQLGMSDQNIEATLDKQNVVVDAGSVDVQTNRLRIAPTGDFLSVDDIAQLTVRPTLLDSLEPRTPGIVGRSNELIRIADIGEVREGYADPPSTIMHQNGMPAIGISITNVAGINVVDMGRAVERRLAQLMAILPVGIEVEKVHWQSDVVAEAINGFLVSFLQAVGIVLVVLTLFMGWRMGVVIGFALVLTILGSFMLMAIFGIDLQRMSLGALVIALGMMVDNAIVVADGYVVRLKQGMEPEEAAVEAARIPAMPLLGATVVAVMAFYPIFASTESAGEYCRTLFSVVAISLLVSWVISMTVTPLQCIDLIKPKAGDEEGKDPYAGAFFQKFRGLLTAAIRFRFFTVAAMVGLLAVSLVAFGNISQQFFPESSMTKFMIDYWTPEGTRIEQVAADVTRAEAHILEDERVAGVASFIGAGPPRFYLPVDPESPNPTYAQLVVNVHDYREIDAITAELTDWFADNLPDALVPIRKFGVGPSNTWKFELRVSGPAVADPGILRGLAGQVEDILAEEPLSAYSRTNWRERVQKLVPEFNEERGRWADISREDLAETTKRTYDGRTIGLYRERDDIIPIVVRAPQVERADIDQIEGLQVQSGISTETVPLSQITDDILTAWEDPTIWRRDRRRTITVQGNPVPSSTLPSLRAAVIAAIDDIELPPGYDIAWGGEYEDTVEAQASLVPGIVPAVAIMGFIIVGLFNAFRPPLVIVFTIPFALIGIAWGLLATGTPFGFLALLGAMSLAGMMIKNAIVLLDEININLAGGWTPYDAVIEAALSRLRPVVLAAATTVLGVVPLLQDVFWIGMAVTLMAGLSFGTLLTMFLVPTLYAILYRIPSPEKG